MATQTARDLAVIVCAYTDERWPLIERVLHALATQNDPVGETVLVIDHNPPLFAKAKATFPAIRVVENTDRRGLSGARNTGIAHSSAPILAFVDDDAFPEPEWSRKIAEPYADLNVIGVGGSIIPAWDPERPGWWPDEFDWVVGCTYRGHVATASPIRNAIGANMSIRREAFLEVGGFSEGLGRVGKHPVGAEETELYIRAHRAFPQTHVQFAPEARVHHFVPADRATHSYFRRRCYAEGLSKAVVAKLAGASDGLSSEKSYVTKTLPLGVLRHVAAVFRGDLYGPMRAGAIIIGLACTASGYLRARFRTVSLRDPKESTASTASSATSPSSTTSPSSDTTAPSTSTREEQA